MSDDNSAPTTTDSSPYAVGGGLPPQPDFSGSDANNDSNVSFGNSAPTDPIVNPYAAAPTVPQSHAGINNAPTGPGAPSNFNVQGGANWNSPTSNATPGFNGQNTYPAPAFGDSQPGVNFATTSGASQATLLRQWSMWLFIASCISFVLSLTGLPLGIIAFPANIAGIITGILAKKGGDPKGNLWFWLNLICVIVGAVLTILVVLLVGAIFVGLAAS